MAPESRFSFLYKFVPERAAGGHIQWRWEARSQSGKLVMESGRAFDTRTECEEHAKAWGYVPPERRR